MQKPCETVQAVPRVMQKKLFVSCKKNKLFHMSCKKSCSTCHEKKLFHMQNRAKNKLFHMLQMQKPCKNHAKCGAYGAPTR